MFSCLSREDSPKNLALPYQTHLKSKDQTAREKVKAPSVLNVGVSESSSDFSVIGAEKAHICMFCSEPETREHLRTQHNFPPFEH